MCVPCVCVYVYAYAYAYVCRCACLCVLFLCSKLKVHTKYSDILNILFTQAGCEDNAVGVSSNSVIINSKLSSSSIHTASTPASNGRLNYTGGPSWCASSSDSSPYLEVDLGSVYIICAVATQGNSRADQWVKTYQIQSSEDKITWTSHREKGQAVVRKTCSDEGTFSFQQSSSIEKIKDNVLLKVPLCRNEKKHTFESSRSLYKLTKAEF